MLDCLYTKFSSLQTSDAYVHAGTNSRIELQIIGDLADGETERVDLNGCFQSGFNRGSLFTVNKQLKYVGTPIMLKISKLFVKQ